MANTEHRFRSLKHEKRCLLYLFNSSTDLHKVISHQNIWYPLLHLHETNPSLKFSCCWVFCESVRFVWLWLYIALKCILQIHIYHSRKAIHWSLVKIYLKTFNANLCSLNSFVYLVLQSQTCMPAFFSSH